MKRYRFLFLDFDGVTIAGGKKAQRDRYYATRVFPDDGFGDNWHPDAVAALQFIVDSVPNLRIVISSTYRSSGMEWLQGLWKSRGLPGEVYDMTGHDETRVRGKEIYDYLMARGACYPVSYWDAPAWDTAREQCDVLSYVILDDDWDMLLRQQKHYVNCNDQIGLTMAKAKRAVRILLADIIHGV